MKSPLGWMLIGAAAVLLLPVAWNLLWWLLKLSFGIAYIAAIVLAVIFLIGWIRRMIVAR